MVKKKNLDNSKKYTYDALGRRISLESQGVTTLFVYCGYQVKTEYESTGGAFTETKSYVHGSYIDDVVAMIDTNNTYYYHSNRQFSVGALTDSLGNLRERYAYNAYGDMEVIYEDLSIDNPYYFTGRRLDSVSGRYYFRARYYDAVLGQFISRDPLGYVDGMGLYNGYFVPMGVDPFGLSFDIIFSSDTPGSFDVTIPIYPGLSVNVNGNMTQETGVCCKNGTFHDWTIERATVGAGITGSTGVGLPAVPTLTIGSASQSGYTECPTPGVSYSVDISFNVTVAGVSGTASYDPKTGKIVYDLDFDWSSVGSASVTVSGTLSGTLTTVVDTGIKCRLPKRLYGCLDEIEPFDTEGITVASF